MIRNPFTRELSRRCLIPSLCLTAGLSLAVGGAAASATQSADPPFGILLMAHGGTSAWNRQVEELAAGLDTELPIELAFGMADRRTLAEAMSALQQAGVDRVAVVRLFVSGESFLEQTEYLLGLDPTVPEVLFDSSRTTGMRPVADSTSIAPIPHTSEVAVVRQGLVDSPLSGRIIAARALLLSNAPERETILVIAHGMGDPDADARLVEALDARAETIRAAAPFRDVAVATLREDWAAPRAAAEQEIRAIVRRGNQDGSTIVVPFRLAGFGPYAEVLEGLQYTADEAGLLPSAAVGNWIVHTANKLACGRGWLPVDCAATLQPQSALSKTH